VSANLCPVDGGKRTLTRQDLRDVPAYTPAQVARYLRLPVATVRAWAVGQPWHRRGSHGFFKPVIQGQRTKSGLAFSFVNLVELHVLSALRRINQLPLGKVRKSLDYLARRYPGVTHPLADLDLLTDGLDLWLEELGSLVAISASGQTGIRDVLETRLRRVEREQSGRALRLFPFTRSAASADEPRVIVIDPRISFGSPVLSATGIPTRILEQRFTDGDSVEHLSRDYGLSRDEIEEAIRWERRVVAA
jgi:uncharacterized protein (DUF433 family)